MTGSGWTEQSLITHAALLGSECNAQLHVSMGFMPTRGLDYMGIEGYFASNSTLPFLPISYWSRGNFYMNGTQRHLDFLKVSRSSFKVYGPWTYGLWTCASGSECFIEPNPPIGWLRREHHHFLPGFLKALQSMKNNPPMATRRSLPRGYKSLTWFTLTDEYHGNSNIVYI